MLWVPSSDGMTIASRADETGGRNPAILSRLCYEPTKANDCFRLQRDALKKAGRRRTFSEKASGARRDRPELARMLNQIREENAVVWTPRDPLA